METQCLANSHKGGFGMPVLRPRQVHRAGEPTPEDAPVQWAKGLPWPKGRPPKRSRSSAGNGKWHRGDTRCLGELEWHWQLQCPAQEGTRLQIKDQGPRLSSRPPFSVGSLAMSTALIPKPGPFPPGFCQQLRQSNRCVSPSGEHTCETFF